MIIVNYDKSNPLKTIELLQDKIKINSMYRTDSFSCPYSEVENLRLEIETVWFQGRYRGYYVCKKFTLIFYIKGKIYKIDKYPFLRVMDPLYKIIDYTRKMQNFEYHIIGGGEPMDLSEKIEKYKNFRHKDSLGEKKKAEFRKIGWIILALPSLATLIAWIAAGPESTDFFIQFIMISIPALLPFVLLIDGYILYDTIQDNKYKKIAKLKEESIKSPIYHILAKVIIGVVLYIILPYLKHLFYT